MVEKFLAEVLGTGALILLGDGVVAGVLLMRSKAQNSGWIVITTGWAFAVFVGVIIAGPISGAHLNPAVTLALAINGATPWAEVPVYWAGEMVGAFIGAVLVYLHYYPHWAETPDADLKLAVYSTGPAIRNTTWNLVSEIIGTFVLVFVIFAFSNNKGPAEGLASLGALPVAFLVLARWHDRVCDQPRPRPRAADRPLPAADPRQARLGLGLFVDSGRRPAHRWRTRGCGLQPHVHKIHALAPGNSATDTARGVRIWRST
jgi:glycerol uptake facilitator protein